MATSYTTNTNLAKPAVADRGWGGPLNANADALDGMSAVGSLCVTAAEVPSASLAVRVAAGTFRKSDGTAATFAGVSSVILPPSATTAVWLTEAGVLTTGASFPAGANVVRLAVVTTSASTVTSVADARTPWSAFGAAGASGAGTVTSVALAAPAGFGVSGSPVTTSGTLALTFGLTGPLYGTGTGVRVATAADVPLFGPSGAAHAPGAVPDPGPTAGTVRYLREDAQWVSPPGGGGATGTVSSVGLALPGDYVVTGSPVTGSGVLTAARASQAQNLFLASPVASAGAPGYRAIYPADLPPFGPSGPTHQAGAVPDPGPTAGTARYLREDGTWQNTSFTVFIGSGPSHAAGAVPDPGPTAGSTRFLREDGAWSTVPSTAGGTVLSVGLSLPAELTVTGSPVTGSGTLAAAWASQAAHAVFAGPAGAAGTPAFRALAAGDIPDLSAVYLTGNQVITFTGDAAGSGATAVTLAIGAGKVTNAHLAGGIAFTKLVGTDVSISAGQVTAGTFNPARLPATGQRVDQHYGAWQPLPAASGGTVTLDWSLSDRWYGTLGNGATALAFTNVPAAGFGQLLLLRLTQPASGTAGTVTWPAGALAANCILSTASGQIDLVSVLLNPAGGFDIILSSGNVH